MSFQERIKRLKESKLAIIISVVLSLIIGLSFYFKWTDNPLNEANAYYLDKNFKQALISYQQLLDEGSLSTEQIKKININMAKSLFEIASEALKLKKDKIVISSCLELNKNFPKSTYVTSCKAQLNTAFLRLTQPLLDDKQYVTILHLMRQSELYLGTLASSLWNAKVKDVRMESQFFIAKDHIQKKEYYLAIAHFKELLALTPNNLWKIKIHNGLQQALFKDGMQEQRDKAYPNALKSFQDLVKLFPNSKLSKQVRGSIEELSKIIDKQNKKWQSEAKQRAEQIKTNIVDEEPKPQKKDKK